MIYESLSLYDSLFNACLIACVYTFYYNICCVMINDHGVMINEKSQRRHTLVNIMFLDWCILK